MPRNANGSADHPHPIGAAAEAQASRWAEAEAPASRGTRKLFAYVPQGNTLFSGTLRENLTMFTDMASDEKIEKADIVIYNNGTIEELQTAVDEALKTFLK